MRNKVRPYWINCGSPEDSNLQEDAEIEQIDELENSIAPLDDTSVQIRNLITRFEVCYHQADIEAMRIIKAIGSCHIEPDSGDRPAQRKAELQAVKDILTAWIAGNSDECSNLSAGEINSKELFACIGKPIPIKIWQVQRIIEKVNAALNPKCSYHGLVLDMVKADGSESTDAREHYRDHADFFDKTVFTMINYSLNGEPSQISLGMAIDIFTPCNWNFANNLKIILEAISGNLNPTDTFAICSLNGQLTHHRKRLIAISNTLNSYHSGSTFNHDIDKELLSLLGDMTDSKRWLAASFDKTIRLQLLI